MYGIFAYIYHKNQPNVGKYTIHGSYGIRMLSKPLEFFATFSLDWPETGKSTFPWPKSWILRGNLHVSAALRSREDERSISSRKERFDPGKVGPYQL